MLTKKHLKNAFLDGQFVLECPQWFWPKISHDDILTGEHKNIGSGLTCQTIKLDKSNKSLLVSLTDTKGNYWYSWIHAED
jgi:hypothetical protein